MGGNFENGHVRFSGKLYFPFSWCFPREIPRGFLVEISGLGPREALDKAVVEAQEMTNATHGGPANSGVYDDFATDIWLSIHEIFGSVKQKTSSRCGMIWLEQLMLYI